MSNEFKRPKDKILNKTAKAIKRLQELNVSKPEPVNGNTQYFRNLVEHLDHAFLLGLKDTISGYWPVVKNFSHKDVVSRIQKLQRISSDLGRSRAWLYLALMESSMESYLRCFSDNKSLVRKYYYREAIMRDEQRLLLLITLASGLDFLKFNLELDLPHLDLAWDYSSLEEEEVSEAATTLETTVRPSHVDKRDSITTHTSLTSSEGDLQENENDPQIDDSSLKNQGGLEINLRTKKTSPSPLTSALDHSARRSPAEVSLSSSVSSSNEIIPGAEEGFRIRTRETTNDTSALDDSFKVIHLHGKKRQKSKKKKSVAKDIPTVKNSADWEKEDWKLSRDAGGKSDEEEDALSIQSSELSSSVSNSIILAEDEKPTESNITIVDGISDYTFNDKHAQVPSLLTDDDPSQRVGITTTVLTEASSSNPSFSPLTTQQELANTVNGEAAAAASSQTGDNYSGQDHADTLDDTLTNSSQAAGTVSTNSEVVALDVAKGLDSPLDKSFVSVYDNPANLYADRPPTSQLDSPETVKGPPLSSIDGSVVENTDNASDDTAGTTSTTSADKAEEREVEELIAFGGGNMAEMRLDNNTKLHLMLDILKNETEKCLKLIQTSCGHTEGEAEPVYVLLTDQALYLLRKSLASEKYTRDTFMRYHNLDYISVSMNYQTITIVCKNRKNKLWLTPGEETVTRFFLSCLLESMTIGSKTKDLPLVDTSASAQKIMLTKLAAQESRSEVSDIRLCLYTLVFWADLSEMNEKEEGGRHLMVSGNKEGALLYKSWEGWFSGYRWKNGYFSIRNGMFYQFVNKADRFPTQTILLKDPEFGGCRRLRGEDNPYSFELIFPDKSTLELAARSEEEVCAWMQAVCHAVALQGGEDQGGGASSAPYLPCCLLVTDRQLLLCHEDLQTNFCRCLASTNLLSLSRLTLDLEFPSYCLLEFRGRTDKPWAIYCVSQAECSKLQSVLTSAWRDATQAELPLCHVMESKVQRYCRKCLQLINVTIHRTDHEGEDLLTQSFNYTKESY